MNITITDNTGAKTVIGVGIFPQGVRRPLRNSFEITGWVEHIFVTLPSGAISTAQPFNIFEGAAVQYGDIIFVQRKSR